MGRRRTWPEWWDRELAFSEHVRKRMVDRWFTELDLRDMLDRATSLRPGDRPCRWAVRTRFGREPWEVIVEPNAEHLLVVITAYPVRQ